MGRGRARSRRAVPWRPPRCRPRLDRRSRARRQRARARVRHREPRGIEKETTRVRRTNRRLRGLLAGVAVLLAAATAGGSSPSSSAVKPETRRRRSSPSALGPRRSSRTTSTARSCSPVRRSRSTVRRRPRYLLQALLHARRKRTGSCTAEPSSSARSRSAGRQDARGWQLRRRTSLLRHPDVRADRRKVAGTTGLSRRASRTARANTLAVGGDGFIRLLDARGRTAETLVDGLVTRLIFSRDGSRLVVATGERSRLDQHPRPCHPRTDRRTDRA